MNVWAEILASPLATAKLPPVPSEICKDKKPTVFWGKNEGRMPGSQNTNRLISCNRKRLI